MNETDKTICPTCPECNSSNTELAFCLFKVDNFFCRNCDSLFSERITKVSDYEYVFKKGPNDPEYKGW